ncbi:unnamed protein product [Amoebophrya sp. A120]|nr:unnamed protein product [Amoebophrya sp. A120]|eukprot:GSA120T00023095001.1
MSPSFLPSSQGRFNFCVSLFLVTSLAVHLYLAPTANAQFVSGEHQQFHIIKPGGPSPPVIHPDQASDPSVIPHIQTQIVTYYHNEQTKAQHASSSIDAVCGAAAAPPFYSEGRDEARLQWTTTSSTGKRKADAEQKIGEIEDGVRSLAKLELNVTTAEEDGGGTSKAVIDEELLLRLYLHYSTNRKINGATTSDVETDAPTTAAVTELQTQLSQVLQLDQPSLLTQLLDTVGNDKVKQLRKQTLDACLILAIFEAVLDKERDEPSDNYNLARPRGPDEVFFHKKANVDYIEQLHQSALFLWRSHFAKSQYKEHRCRHFFLAKQIQKDAEEFRVAANRTLWIAASAARKNEQGQHLNLEEVKTTTTYGASLATYATFYATTLAASPEWSGQNRDLLELQLYQPSYMRCYSRLAFVRPPIFVWPVMWSTSIAYQRLRDDPVASPKEVGHTVGGHEAHATRTGKFWDSTYNFFVTPSAEHAAHVDYALDSSYVFEDPSDKLRHRKIRFARIDQIQHLSVLKHLLLHKPGAYKVNDSSHSAQLSHAISHHLLPPWFEQIIEFGGGTGELVALVFEEAKQFGKKQNPRFLIYDTPPMLNLQKYFLRFSGLPAKLVKTTGTTTSTGRKITTTPAAGTTTSTTSSATMPALAPTNKEQLSSEILLLPSTVFQKDRQLFHNTVKKQLLPSNTLVVGFYSLSEAPLTVRKRFLSAVTDEKQNQPPATVLLVLNSFDGMRWSQSIADMKKEFFDRYDYEACCWRMDHFGRLEGTSAVSYYFVAVRKSAWANWKSEVGSAHGSEAKHALPASLRCEPAIGCNAATLAKEFSTCTVPGSSGVGNSGVGSSGVGSGVGDGGEIKHATINGSVDDVVSKNSTATTRGGSESSNSTEDEMKHTVEKKPDLEKTRSNAAT